MLILLIIYLVLGLVDLQLFDFVLRFVKLVFLLVDEMLKLPGLSYSITGILKPLLIRLVHLKRSHTHLCFNFWLVGNVSILTHNEVQNRLILGLVLEQFRVLSSPDLLLLERIIGLFSILK